MSGYDRTERIADEIKRLLGELLEREVRDPRVGFVTVMGVEVTSDLAYATVYVTAGEGEDVGEVLAGLAAAAGFLRRRLGESLSLRHIPELRFHEDASIERGFRMDALLKRLAEERGDE